MKLLLVDDEEYSRDGIEKLVDDHCPDIDTIKTAADGKAGVECAKQFLPEIVLADVKMPFMDGLEMCRQIKEFNPSCTFIIISGYADKEYLKSAIRLSAINYIEKPYLPDELIDTVNRAIKRQQQIGNIQTIQSTLADEQENDLVLSIIRPGIHNSPVLAEPYSNSLNFKMEPSKPWNCLLISFFPAESSTPLPAKGSLAYRRLLKDIRLCFSDGHERTCFIGTKREDLIVVLFSSDTSVQPDQWIPRLKFALSKWLDNRGSFIIGVGTPFSSLEETFSSYEDASIELQHCFFTGPCSICFPPVPAQAVSSGFYPNAEFVDQFSDILKAGTCGQARTFLDTIYENILCNSYTLVSTVKDFYCQLVRRVYYYKDPLIFSDLENHESLSDSIQAIWQFHFLKECHEYTKKKVQHLFSLANLHTKSNDCPLAYRIKKYIDDNFSDPDLCLQEISDHFSITSSYICIVFKKEYGKTVNQYLSGKRIDEAMHYFRTSDKKIKDISCTCGFQDENYFTKVFKKSTGFTPKEYKRQSMVNHYSSEHMTRG